MKGAPLAGGLVVALALVTGARAEGLDLPAANFDAGVVAYLEGDLDTAAAHWRPLAEAGDAAAQFNLGSLYLPAGPAALASDVVEAAWWFGRAARQGHAQAQYELAVVYRDGGDGTSALTVPADGEMALKWLSAAAARGHGPAQADLGLVYLGLGTGSLAEVAVDKVTAWKWLSLARDQGSATAAAALDGLSARLTADERRAAEQAAGLAAPARGVEVGF